MITNIMYIPNMVVIFKYNKIVGWMVVKDANILCKKYPYYSWDYYQPHMDYIKLDELPYMSY
jgi:hypothetical protein